MQKILFKNEYYTCTYDPSYSSGLGTQLLNIARDVIMGRGQIPILEEFLCVAQECLEEANGTNTIQRR